MMTSLKNFTAMSLALGVVSLGTPVFADVTAEQVWADWRGYMAASGYEITATEAREGKVLQVTDIAMTMAVPEDDVSITMSLPEMGFVDNGDGTVSITVPESLPITVAVDSAEDDVAIGATYATTDLSIMVSGDPDDIVYDYNAAKLAITVDTIEAEGEQISFDQMGAVELTMADVAGNSRSTGGDLRTVKQALTSGAISYLVDINDPEGSGERLTLRGSAAGMETDATVMMPLGVDMQDMSKAVAAGFALQGEFRMSESGIEFTFQEEAGTTQGSSKSSSSRLTVDMGADGLAYGGGAKGMDVALAGGELPLPVSFTMAEADFAFELPVMAGDDPQPFAFGLTLGDLAVPDLIWGLLDPTGQLPRDPATLSFRLDGMAKLLIDLLDPAEMEKLDSGEVNPGELQSVDLSGLVLRIAGAELTGDGAFSFDNMKEMFGMPAPAGALNLKLVGGNGLLDKLEKMGLLPAEEAGGMRMMMGLFAQPGDGPDTLTSKIEVTEEGHILANGQRIQ